VSGPLQGRRVLVTRTRERAAGLVDRLHACGAEAVVVPLIATVVIATPEAIAAEAARLASAQGARWAAFTSATAVRLVMGVVEPAAMAGVRLAAVGDETARALRERGHEPSLVPADASAAGLARALRERGAHGATVWFPAAEGAGPALERALSAAGARVWRQNVYRSEMPAGAPQRLWAALDRPVDAVTLTSGSTARNLLIALEGRALDPAVLIACIGETTARQARAAGLTNVAAAAEPSAEALVGLLRARLGAAQPLP